ncbi:MAG: hypothetical protein WC819_03975 [Parcubacteria group bacterium]|jgi:hypothetical protein
MHYTIVAVIPFEFSLREDVKNKIENDKYNFMNYFTGKLFKPLNHYDIDKKVKPYKVYYAQDEVDRILKNGSTDINNKKSILEKIKNWNCDLSSGIENGRYYVMRDKNPHGMFDYWNVYDVCMIEDVLKNEEFVEHAIFTPDCKMITSDQYFIRVGESNEKEFEIWKKRFQKILKSYPLDCFILFIDCHT